MERHLRPNPPTPPPHGVATAGSRGWGGSTPPPLPPPMVAQSGQDLPSLDLALALRAGEIVLAVIAGG